MSTASLFEAWFGSPHPPDPRHELRAGPVTALLEGPDLRSIRVGGVELLQRIYVAVRDSPGWNTIPGVVEDMVVEHHDEGFQVGFTSHHRYGDIDYSWTAVIEGRGDGTVTYEMRGVANRSFTHSKIGFNLHHPLDTYVGARYRAQTRGGQIVGELPRQIDPQLVRDGTLTAMFDYFDQLVVELPHGIEAVFDFEGDHFEMQDHRNWSDANYKTYGTPLAFGFPMDVDAGTELYQKVTIRFRGSPSVAWDTGPAQVTLGERTDRRLPPIGLGMASHGRDLGAHEVALLSRVRPDHLRVDLHLASEDADAQLGRGIRACGALGAGMELALFVTDGGDEAVDRVGAHLSDTGIEVRRVLVFEEADGFSAMRGTTPPEVVDAVRKRLTEPLGAPPFAGGTNQFFNELNRDRPDPALLDGVAYSLNPQVHACDNRSVMGNVTPYRDIAASTRTLCGDIPIFLSPVTLIGRSGPFPAGPPDPDGLPGPVDVRQAALFGAAWALGAIGGMAHAGFASLTFFETSGWLGLVQDVQGPPHKEFPARANQALPLYHVFADVAERADAALVVVESSDLTRITALAFAEEQGTRLLVANLTDEVQRLQVRGAGEGEARIRVLDDTTRVLAMADPDAFRAMPPLIAPLHDGQLDLILSPYAVANMGIWQRPGHDLAEAVTRNVPR